MLFYFQLLHNDSGAVFQCLGAKSKHMLANTEASFVFRCLLRGARVPVNCVRCLEQNIKLKQSVQIAVLAAIAAFPGLAKALGSHPRLPSSPL